MTVDAEDSQVLHGMVRRLLIEVMDMKWTFGKSANAAGLVRGEHDLGDSLRRDSRTGLGHGPILGLPERASCMDRPVKVAGHGPGSRSVWGAFSILRSPLKKGTGMPLDPSTFESETPRTLDGRAYPDHLRPYERLDADLLPIAVSLGEFESSELGSAIEDRRVATSVSRWIASAEWRGLISRQDRSMSDRRTYAPDGPRVQRRLAELSR